MNVYHIILEMNKQFFEEKHSKKEIVEINGEDVDIYYVPKETLKPGDYGRAYYKEKMIIVRDDLPKKMIRFVLAHEKHHLEHDKPDMSIEEREIRATFTPALKDPMGYLSAIFYKMFDFEAKKFIRDRARKGY